MPRRLRGRQRRMHGHVWQRGVHVRRGQRLPILVQNVALPRRLQRRIVQRNLRERQLQLRPRRELRFSLLEGPLPRELPGRQHRLRRHVRKRHLPLRPEQPLRLRLRRSQLPRHVRCGLDLHAHLPRRLARHAGLHHRLRRRRASDVLGRYDRVRRRLPSVARALWNGASGCPPQKKNPPPVPSRSHGDHTIAFSRFRIGWEVFGRRRPRTALRSKPFRSSRELRDVI